MASSSNERLFQKVLNDMVASELMSQEAEKRYGETSPKKALEKLYAEEIRKKTPIAGSKLAQKKNELKRFRQYIAEIKATADVRMYTVKKQPL